MKKKREKVKKNLKVRQDKEKLAQQRLLKDKNKAKEEALEAKAENIAEENKSKE